jgi:hypothetical protein
LSDHLLADVAIFGTHSAGAYQLSEDELAVLRRAIERV